MSEPVITYDELVMWRNICEWMSARGGYAQSETLIKRFGEAVTPLVSYDRTHRQKLWDSYQIQLIIWEKEDRRYGCWALKANWELKIHFLEQIVLLGKDPEQTPKLYLDVLLKHQAKREKKALAKRRKECLKEIRRELTGIQDRLEILSTISYLPSVDFADGEAVQVTRYRLEEIRNRIAKARSLLQEWREKFDEGPQPEPDSVVLGEQRQPQPTDAVLGGKR